MLLEQEDNVEDEGDHHDHRVQDLKLVVKELQAEDEYLKGNLYHKEGQDGDAHPVEHLRRTRSHSQEMGPWLTAWPQGPHPAYQRKTSLARQTLCSMLEIQP